MHTDHVLELENLELAFEGDREGIVDLLEMALADGLERSVRLQAALDGAEWAAASQLAHAIKGAAANVGAFGVSRIAGGIESALRRGDVHAANGAREPLAAAFLQFEAAVTSYRERT